MKADDPAAARPARRHSCGVSAVRIRVQRDTPATLLRWRANATGLHQVSSASIASTHASAKPSAPSSSAGTPIHSVPQQPGQPGRLERHRDRRDRRRHQPRERSGDRHQRRHHADRRVQRERQRPLRSHPVRLDPRLVLRVAQLVVQPAGSAPLGVGARSPGLEAGEAFGNGIDVGHVQRAIIPRPVASAAVTAATATELAFAGLARHADLIAAGEISSRELAELFLARIARCDPLLNAYRVVFDEQALAEADQADGRAGAGDRRAAARRPDRDQGRHRRRRRDDRLRLRRRTAARSPPTPRWSAACAPPAR